MQANLPSPQQAPAAMGSSQWRKSASSDIRCGLPPIPHLSLCRIPRKSPPDRPLNVCIKPRPNLWFLFDSSNPARLPQPASDEFPIQRACPTISSPPHHEAPCPPPPVPWIGSSRVCRRPAHCRQVHCDPQVRSQIQQRKVPFRLGKRPHWRQQRVGRLRPVSGHYPQVRCQWVRGLRRCLFPAGSRADSRQLRREGPPLVPSERRV